MLWPGHTSWIVGDGTGFELVMKQFFLAADGIFRMALMARYEHLAHLQGGAGPDCAFRAGCGGDFAA